MRHEPCDAAVAVEKRVNPYETVMRRRSREDGLGLSEFAVNLLEPSQETRHSTRADGGVLADLDIMIARRTREHSLVFDSEKILGQQFAKAVVDFADRVGGKGAAFEATRVDPLLDSNVRSSLKLEVAFFCVLAVVVFKGALDIDRMRVVSFDQIAVVTVHRADESSERDQQTLGKRAAKSSALLRQLKGKIGQDGTVRGALCDQQRLHHRNRLTPVFDRFNVLFRVHTLSRNISLYIDYLK